MDPTTPPDSADRTAATVPDPHASEPAPPPSEGMRPEADATRIRPEQDEPGGPLGGLLSATSTEVANEATPGDDPGAEALLAQMGVEEEGIESGQLLGFVIATFLAVGVLAILLIYLIYTPYRAETQAAAEDVEQYPELQQSVVDAQAKLTQATRSGDTYTVPIGRAMGLVAAEYGSQATGPAYAESIAGVPTTRAEWNTLMVNRTAGRALQAAPARSTPLRADSSLATVRPVVPATDEEVGVDDIPDNPEAPEPRPDI